VILGFTGSRHGMTQPQHRELVKWLKVVQPTEVHHGDCMGSDARFHEIVRKLLPATKIVTHPPLADVFRAFCKGDEERDPAPYLVRDEHILDESERLFATPDSEVERKRGSGTWYTIRVAVDRRTDHVIFYPNGTLMIVEYGEYDSLEDRS
jgi:hypothetical protein